MEEYKPNSNRYKREVAEQANREKIEPVAKGKTKRKNKVIETFISEDAGNIKQYVIMDVLVPAIKKAVSDIVTDGISMLLYGDTGHSNKRSRSSYVSYDRFADRGEPRPRVRAGYAYNEIVLDTRSEAEEILDRMFELIEAYQHVSVADMYDLADISNNNYTNNRYGWTNLRNAEVVRVRDGYMLKLPKALPLD